MILKRRKTLSITYYSFDFKTKEDFIYYILFTAEQLEMNPDKIKAYATDVAFISDRGKKESQTLINELLESIDEALIRKMKK